MKKLTESFNVTKSLDSFTSAMQEFSDDTMELRETLMEVLDVVYDIEQRGFNISEYQSFLKDVHSQLFDFSKKWDF